ncbi:MAG: DUF302 domain-containing protein [Brevundimonas sp.]|jgi:uncharacterized protein (DUF302 family)|uniref:DUF302 domain-containing protein n=1 Tax=Brevundimonas sp. TaxID=1871086 RepID=UPI0025C71077|nr:DUF302 domain-containing protein [Brevundimonas sp.]MCH4267254.1 DUF302 domain-containing protein [Brevundimonas sp.]
MSYYHSRRTSLSFEEAVARTREALKAEHFGVITEIDVSQTFKQKLDVDFRPYVILGACNPRAAFEALGMEDKVGVMLPCNVIIQASPSGPGCEIAAVDPVASMSAIDNPALKAKAQEIGAGLRRVIDAVVA